MMIEVGDFSEFGEVWIRYQGNVAIDDYTQLLRNRERVDPAGLFSEDRKPELVHRYDIDEEDLVGNYVAGRCWVFSVQPKPPARTAQTRIAS